MATVAEITGKFIKKHGENSIKKGNEYDEVTRLPTGVFEVDLATGGGLPRGRVTEVYGPESSGKCLTADTHVIVPGGLVTLEEVFSALGIPLSGLPGEIPAQFDFLNENKVFETTACFTRNGVQPVVRLRASNGLELKATPNHPVRVLGPEGSVVWRKAGEVQPGNRLAVLRGTEVFGDGPLSPDEAELLGLLVADGSYGGVNGRQQIRFSNDDPCLKARFVALTSAYLKEPLCYPREGGSVDYCVSSKSLVPAFLGKHFVGRDLSRGKTVPLSVRCAGREAVLAFLRAYVDCEGHFGKGNQIVVSSASEMLIRQVQLMLLNLGIVSSAWPKEVVGYDHTYWCLGIFGPEAFKYLETVGSGSHRHRAEVAARFKVRTQDQTNTDSIPGAADLVRGLTGLGVTDRVFDRLARDALVGRCHLTYARLRQILEWAATRTWPEEAEPTLMRLRGILDRRLLFVEVSAVEALEPQATFDVCLPGTHSFWSNGLISHNTNLVLKAIASNQRLHPEQDNVYFDLENVYVPSWAASLGVDTTKLLIVKPQPADIIIDIFEAFLYADNIGVVALDSIAALVTQNEIDSAGEKVAVAGVSGPVAKLVRKVTFGLAAQAERNHYPVVIYVNQIRYKIGVMFGNPETTPGGNAPRFQYSLRIRCYGKNIANEKIHKTMPILKETQFIIQKWKMPIVATHGVYQMVTLAHSGMTIGETDNWNLVLGYLKDYGFVAKKAKGTGWLAFDQEYKTLKEIEEQYHGDPAWAALVRKAVVERLMDDEAAPPPEGDFEIEEKTGALVKEPA